MVRRGSDIEAAAHRPQDSVSHSSVAMSCKVQAHNLYFTTNTLGWKGLGPSKNVKSIFMKMMTR